MRNSKNFFDLEDDYSSYENSEVVILRSPYEKSTSYVMGTSKAPDAILNAFFPDILIMPMPPLPIGVATAAMVDGSVYILLDPLIS